GALREQMNVSHVEEIVEAVERLKREEGDVAESRDGLFELAAIGSVSAEDKMKKLVIPQAGGKPRENFQSLLGSHVSGIKEDNLIGGNAELGAEGAGLGLGVDGVRVHPIGKEGDARGLNSLLLEAIHHGRGDGGELRKGAADDALAILSERVRPSSRGQKAKIEGGVHLKVLDVEPGGNSAKAGGEQGYRRGDKGRLHGEHEVRMPRGLSQHDGKAAGRERSEMGNAATSAKSGGDPEGAAVDFSPGGRCFPTVTPGRVALADFPCRVIGRGGDHPDFMAARSKPLHHFS